MHSQINIIVEVVFEKVEACNFEQIMMLKQRCLKFYFISCLKATAMDGNSKSAVSA